MTIFDGRVEYGRAIQQGREIIELKINEGVYNGVRPLYTLIVSQQLQDGTDYLIIIEPDLPYGQMMYKDIGIEEAKGPVKAEIYLADPQYNLERGYKAQLQYTSWRIKP